MTTALSPAQTYLAAVAAALADLGAEDRGELLDDLAAHLAAVEQEDGDIALSVRLGPPERYAAELRAAAGLPAAESPAANGGRLRTLLEDDWQRLSQTTAGREVRAFLPLLAPGWWVLRAYLAVFVLALMSGSGLRGAVLLDVGLPPVGWALLAAAVVASVRLGRGPLTQPKRQLLRIGEVALGLVAFSVLLGGVGVSGVQTVYVQDSAPLAADDTWPLLSPAGPVTDVLPYAADGTPLEGVLLFDQDGRPLRVGEQEWWADGCRRVPRPPLATDGVPVPFSYPQRYVLDESDSYGVPGQCDRDLPRPEVPLPDLPAQDTTTPPAPPAPAAPVAPADPAAPVAPVEPVEPQPAG